MRWFSRKPTQQKYVEAAITVASNLYLHTIPEAEDAPAPLHFSLPDSRFRYMIFCLSAAVIAALVYDERKHVQPDSLISGCLHFAALAATENPQGDIEAAANPQDAATYFQEFLKHWAQWPVLEKQARNAEIIELISVMIHTAESTLPADAADMRRLSPLALEIHCRLPTMRGAFVELASQ